MTAQIKLHHFSVIVKHGYLELTKEFFELLGLRIGFAAEDKSFYMMNQPGTKIDIQISESSVKMETNQETKIRTHIAFVSDKPHEIFKRVEQWASEKELEFNSGSWSDTQLWFDLPDIFTNFVIELMDVKVIQ